MNLSPEEQAVFRRLSLFRSSFTAEAAQTVAEAGPLLLINLLDKSLLRPVSAGRYDMHQVLRHFAQEKLAETPDEQTQTLGRYRHYYTKFLRQRAEALQCGKNLAEKIAEIFTEIDNLWAGWAQVTGQTNAQEFAPALIRTFHIAYYSQFVLLLDSLQLIEYQHQLLASRSNEADICLIDVNGIDTLADHLLDLTKDFEREPQNHFSIIIENNTVDNRLVALPFGTNLGGTLLSGRPAGQIWFCHPPDHLG